jgi:predicted site-specific integrase-resolvase
MPTASVLLPLPEDNNTYIPASRLPSHIGIAAQTLARWRCEGRGPEFTKVGRRVAYRSGAVRAWLKGREYKNTILAAEH